MLLESHLATVKTLNLIKSCFQLTGGDVFLVDSQWEALDCWHPDQYSKTNDSHEFLAQIASQVDLSSAEDFRTAPIKVRNHTGIDQTGQCITATLPDIQDVYLVLLFIQSNQLMEEYTRGIVAVSNHELRTPLMIISSAAQLLLSKVSDKDKELEQISKMLNESIFRLTSTIEKLLDYGNLLTPFPVSEFRELSLRKIMLAVMEKKNEQNNRISWHTRFPDSELTMMGDPEALQKAFDVILENALNFSKEEAHVSVLVYADQKLGQCFVKITDEGIGISADQMSSVFDGFFHGEDIDYKHTPGLGLGLTIAKKIFALHAGRIYLDSSDGAGTSVTIKLPLLVNT